MDGREAAWWAVHAALERLPGWRVTPSLLYGEEHPPRWHVTAVNADVRGRRTMHEALEGVGATEIEAFVMLAGRRRLPDVWVMAGRMRRARG